MVCKETGRSAEDLSSEASAILEEMGHEFSETILRCIGGFIRKEGDLKIRTLNHSSF